MKKVYAICAITALSFGAMAQDSENIVNNGDFESIGKKPKRLGKIESATGWISATGVKADLFVDSKIPEIGTPSNIYGAEDPKDGSNYAGIVAFSYGDKMPRSYIMNKLSSPLKKGVTYCVKMNISLAEASKYASNNVGVLFSKKDLATTTKTPIIEEPSVVHWDNDQTIVTARYNWTEICGSFVAKGGEKFITIGNFNSNAETKSERMKKDPKVKDIKVSQILAAYYYVDAISVQMVDEKQNEKCECDVADPTAGFSKLVYQKSVVLDDKMSAQEKIEAHQVFFAFGNSRLTAEGKNTLKSIAEILKANPSNKLRIFGFSTEEEEKAALQTPDIADVDNGRIGAVMNYLNELGIESSRIIPTRKGAGSINEKEISETDEDELRQAKNRRVEFELK